MTYLTDDTHPIDIIIIVVVLRCRTSLSVRFSFVVNKIVQRTDNTEFVIRVWVPTACKLACTFSVVVLFFSKTIFSRLIEDKISTIFIIFYTEIKKKLNKNSTEAIPQSAIRYTMSRTCECH